MSSVLTWKDMAWQIQQRDHFEVLKKDPPMSNDKSQMVELVRCDACGQTWLSPFKICKRCKPHERHAEVRAMHEGARAARALTMRHHFDALLAVLDDGTYVVVRDAYHVVRDDVAESREDLIRDLAATKKELTEVLAENARMRRRLESKT